MGRLKVTKISLVILIGLLIGDAILAINYFDKEGKNFLLFNKVAALLVNLDTKSFHQVIKISEINSEPTSGGASWTDYNGDGYLDLAIPDQSGKYRIYRNNHNETFTEVTGEVGLGSTPAANAAVFGDYDNDGCEDIYISTAGPLRKREVASDRLYHNNCNGTFSDVSIRAGISDHYHGYGAAWADYDRDGYLDIYVANWGTLENDANSADRSHWLVEPNILYHNNGDGTFTNVTAIAGVSGLPNCGPVKPFPKYSKKENRPNPSTPLSSLSGGKPDWGALWFDYNNDGYPDLYVANDDGISVLYKNNGNGTFKDTTAKAGLCHIGSGMGLTAGDYDEDGNLDLYVTHTDRNLLWHNNGDGTFTDVSEDIGVANFGFLGWGTNFFDYDNDGYLDLYAVNGTTGEGTPESSRVRHRIHDKRDRLYRNNGDGTFTEVSEKEGILGNDSKSAAAFGDYNNDGFVDIFIVSDDFKDQPDGSSNRLYKNRPNGNHWLTVQLIGTKSNRDAVGARIIIKSGNKSQAREIISGSSLLSQNSLWQTFGLGKNKMVDEIEIKWPSGLQKVLYNIKADRKVVVTEGAGL